MYNLTTNREIMSPSERIENAEASCESINDHIDSIGEFWKILHRALVFAENLKLFLKKQISVGSCRSFWKHERLGGRDDTDANGSGQLPSKNDAGIVFHSK